MYFNFRNQSKILYFFLLLFILFFSIYIIVYFLLKWLKKYKANLNKTKQKEQILSEILKSDDKDKINLILKYLNISNTYELSKELNLDTKELDYIFKSWKASVLSDLLLKKVKWN